MPPAIMRFVRVKYARNVFGGVMSNSTSVATPTLPPKVEPFEGLPVAEMVPTYFFEIRVAGGLNSITNILNNTREME